MSDWNIWRQKIQALIENSPGKLLDRLNSQNHVEILREILGIDDHESTFLQEANNIASAAARLNISGYQDIDGININNDNLYLTHPLSGQQLKLETFENQSTQLQQTIQKSLKNIPQNIKEDPKKLYLWLWRNWSKTPQHTEGEQLGMIWDLLPADRTIPDHSIWTHQNLTSAITVALPQPAFLLFTLGPVQAFISAARRTQDLWAGSYLLSYLTWSAIEVIAENLGPDAVIFPNLYEQPLCDRWLYEKKVWSKLPSPDNLILPSLPNRFLAIVPQEQGAFLAKEAEKKLRENWQEITQTVRQDIESILGTEPQWSQTWEKQTQNLFEIYWQIYPWLPDRSENEETSHQFLNFHRSYLGDRVQKIEERLKNYATLGEKEQEYLNVGAIYSDLYYITEKALGSRKGVRNFAQVEEKGESSTLGGDRAALYDGIDNLITPEGNFDDDDMGRKEIAHFWKELSSQLQKKRRYEIKESGERLDAVELTKRLIWGSYFENKEGYEQKKQKEKKEKGQYKLRFPSTSSIATATFKVNVINRLKQPNSKKLYDALINWINSIPKGIRYRNTVRQDIIPYLLKLTKTPELEQYKKYVKQFLLLDGRLLFGESYDDDEVAEFVTEQELKKTLKSLQTFLKIAQSYNIKKPRKYYAVLMMDGDGMGQWLSGAKMPKYGKTLHPDVLSSLENKNNWQNILESPRLMSPAIHGFVSKALGDFSLKLVRYIVEIRHPGKLVYAGGDDVLALLPLDSTLEIARELRAAFSGEIDTGNWTTEQQERKFEVSFGEQHTGYLCLEASPGETQLLSTMGNTATASAGIVISHHKDPLDITLQQVRKTEKNAKSIEGRNAFSITFLKRSGETVSAGAKWTYTEDSNQEIWDTVAILQDFQARFTNNTLSSKFPYVLREEAETLSLLEISELYQAEIKRLLLRQQGKETLSKQEAENLAQKLASVVIQANKEQKMNLSPTEKTNSPKKLIEFADLLSLTRFLAISEGEE